MNTHYLAENKLLKLSPDLHGRYTRCIGFADHLLGRYINNFPEFTDHSLLHSMEVTNFCNYLISNRIDILNANELYILLMACLLHDSGMGCSEAELEKHGILRLHPEKTAVELIRAYHHDLGAKFVMENWQDCLIPDYETAEIIAEVGRGHRKTDLMDRNLYPVRPGLNAAYLAAVLRLADELDISASRNLMLEFTGFVPSNNKDAMEFKKHRSLKGVLVGERFIICAETDDEKEFKELSQLCEKTMETLTYCQSIVSSCTGDYLPLREIANEIKFTGTFASLRLKSDRVDGTLIIVLEGRLDSESSAVLDKELADSLGGLITNLTLDFGALSFISSAGLRVILGAQKKISRLCGKMIIKKVSPEVMNIFNMTGFNNFLNLEAL